MGKTHDSGEQGVYRRSSDRIKRAKKLCEAEGVPPTIENLKAAIEGRRPRRDRIFRKAYAIGLLLRPTLLTFVVAHFFWFHGELDLVDSILLVIFWASSQGFVAIRTGEIW